MLNYCSSFPDDATQAVSHINRDIFKIHYLSLMQIHKADFLSRLLYFLCQHFAAVRSKAFGPL